MRRSKELLVTFRLDADEYQDLGENMMPMAQQDAWELIFKRAEMNVLETLLNHAVRPSGNETMDQLFRECLEKELEAIRAAALTATYEIVDAREET